MRKLLAVLLLLPALAAAQVSIWTKGPNSGGVAPDGTVTSSSLLLPDGTATSPSWQWVSDNDGTGTGMYRVGTGIIGISANGVGLYEFTTGTFQLASAQTLTWSSGLINAASDVQLVRDAADTLAQKRTGNPQINRLYFSTTGPVYWQTTARTAGALFTAVGGAGQVSYAQPAVPTVTTNGGTSPVCVGTDTAMTCTEGTAPPAAATFTVTFSGTWPAAPSCVAMRGTTGASPLVQGVVTGTTTVVVNLSANLVASEKFHIHCYGVS